MPEQNRPALTELATGQVVVDTTLQFSRTDLVKYAGVSKDYNFIHWNERFAKEVGLDNVIAHGMLTMAAVIAPITDWLGDPGAVLDYRTRFTNPVVVPDSESGTPDQPTAFLHLTATIGAIDEEERTARLDVAVSAGKTSVLGRTQVKVRLP